MQEGQVLNIGCKPLFKTKMEFSSILIGSTHGFIDDFLKQKEIIKLIKPEFVLYEELENLELDSKEKFYELFENKKISDMTSFEEVERLVKLCFEEGIKLIGIDIKNFGFNNILRKKIKNQEELTKLEEEEIKNIIESRERKHLDKILEYNKKTSRQIIVILGSWHLREGSLLRKKLKNYKLILPCDKNNKPLFEPTNDKDIKYREMISNDS